jgi:hypothetical protein
MIAPRSEDRLAYVRYQTRRGDGAVKKTQISGLVIFAVLAFGAVLVAPALAETTLLAEWLVIGEPVTAKLASATTGWLELEDSKVLGSKIAARCSIALDGSIGPNGEGEIAEMLNFLGEKISSTPLSGLALICENVTNCGGSAEVYPAGLPWKTLLLLMENGEILNLIVGFGFEATCTVLGVRVTDDCSSKENDGEYLVENGAGQALATGVVLPHGNCTVGGSESGRAEFLHDPISVNVGVVTVSSE